MKYLLLAQVIFILCSCNSSKDINLSDEQNQSSQVDGFEIKLSTIVLTEQDSYPGVYSNLRNVRNYKIQISSEMNEEITFTNLFVDSVKVPLRAMKFEEDWLVGSDFAIRGKFDSIEFLASRNFYNNNATTEFISDPIIYELSGEDLPRGEAKIEYLLFGTLHTYELGMIKVLESQYHP